MDLRFSSDHTGIYIDRCFQCDSEVVKKYEKVCGKDYNAGDENSPSSTGANIILPEKWCQYREEGAPRRGRGGCGCPGRPGGKAQPGEEVDGG